MILAPGGITAALMPIGPRSAELFKIDHSPCMDVGHHLCHERTQAETAPCSYCALSDLRCQT
jgi:hypothetical protein